MAGPLYTPPSPLQTLYGEVYKFTAKRRTQGIVNSRGKEGIHTFMKNVQIVFNIQVPDHISEEEVNSRLHQVISSLMAQEFGGQSLADQPAGLPPDGHDGQVGHA